MICPCNGRSKQANTYARCCLKKGNRCWRLVKVMTTTNRAEAEMLLRHKEEVRREALARGADVEQQPLFPHMRAPGYGQQVMEWKREMMAERVREGSIEEAFAFAALRVDFECQPWRRDGVWAVSVEGEARCDEWNARVDEYMAAGRHGRAAFDVAKAAKISKTGGPGHAWCGNGGCAEEEQRACAFEPGVPRAGLEAAHALIDAECVGPAPLSPGCRARWGTRRRSSSASLASNP
eukprot:40785-Rhodomonas_salina.1